MLWARQQRKSSWIIINGEADAAFQDSGNASHPANLKER